MKFAAKLILIILFVPLFLTSLLTYSAKFQILNAGFWQKTFDTYDVYGNAANILRDYANNKVTKEGGNKNDVKVLTDLITKENLKDFFDRNLTNILQFVNGKSAEISVYVPINKIPKNLVPKELRGIPDQLTLSQLLTKFNIAGVPLEQIATAKNLGQGTNYSFLTTFFLTLLFLVLLFLLVDSGARFIAPGIALILSGVLTLVASKGGTLSAENLAKQFVGSKEVSQLLLGIIVPALTNEILKTWFWVGLIAVVLGIALFFVRRPSYNNSK